MAIASCPRCESDRLFRFEPAENMRGKVDDLPVVCRSCGQVAIGDQAIVLPPAMEEHAKTLAQASAEAGQEAATDLKDPATQAATYLGRFWRNAYLEGFWRALAFWRHEAKEGRLRRLRELWKKMTVTSAGVFQMPPEAYAEFEALLHFGVSPGDDDASASNQRPPVPPSQALVPGRQG